jgi:protein-S-isoprenylcysteine O-methyltransferase Ste14
MTEAPMTGGHLSRAQLAVTAIVRLALGVVLLGALLFVPAGTLVYREAWTFLAVLFVPVALVFAYLLVRDPALLERRMRTREKEAAQERIVRLGSVCYLLTFLVPGLDHRFAWSSVPAAAVLLADLVFVLGYALFVQVLRVNSYASRVVEVEEGQRVASTGPYAIVRHPMYVAVLLMILSSPVALGSWWALIPAVAVIGIMVTRIRNEEAVLARDLPGYREYRAMTRYRLLPGIW